MATYYVGSGGNNGNSGTSWANRRLTLTSIETLVAVGDIVYVGPGTYRETLTCTTTGSSGNIIKYIADLTGTNTDGVGGRCRITGSDNDTTATRASCIVINSSVNFRTFTGFDYDTTTGVAITANSGQNDIVIEDFSYAGMALSGGFFQALNAISGANIILRRGVIVHSTGSLGLPNAIDIEHNGGSAINTSGVIIEDILFLGGYQCVVLNQMGDAVVRSCFFGWCAGEAVISTSLLNSGHPVTVYNNLLLGTGGFRSGATADLTEDYNIGWPSIPLNTVTAGAHSAAAPIALDFVGRLFNNGRPEFFRPFAPLWGSAANLGTGASNGAATDLFGAARPQGLSVDGGAVESIPTPLKNTGTVRTGSNSLEIPGRGFTDVEIPVAASQAITCQVYVKWDNNANIGSKPSIKLLADYGVTEQTATATGGGTASWEALSVTGTPNADGVMILRLLNNSTFTSTISAYFDDLTVT